MEKINVVLVVLNEKFLQRTLEALNPSSTNLVAVITENGNNKLLNVGVKKVPYFPFAAIPSLAHQSKDFVWLICGWVHDMSDIYRTKKFLMNCGVAEENIVNFEVASCISSKWIANLRHVEKFGANFFATGDDCTETGLNLHCIPKSRSGAGVNLSSSNQDLHQSFLTAKYVFEHVAPGTIKFVLIGLAPYSLRCENAKDFAACTHNLQYMLALNAPAQNNHDRLLQSLINDKVKNFIASIKADRADLNFDGMKNFFNHKLSAKALVDWESELKNLTKKLFPESVEKNFRILKDYIQLCVDHGAKPVGVIFPFALAMHDNYDKKLLMLFRMMIRQLEETSEFTCVDLFDMQIGYEYFYDMAHLNLRGASFASSRLALQLYDKKLLRLEDFLGMNYGYFYTLSYLIPKDSYNALMDKIFAASVERLRRKNKIKVGFVLYDSSMWCGDKLYNYFARDERFEPTVFLCLRQDKHDDELVRKDFFHGVRQFKSHGLNIMPLTEKNFAVPAQDVLIFLTPYFYVLPDAFNMQNINANTLAAYIPYSFQVAHDYLENHSPIFYMMWKIFFSSPLNLNLIDSVCKFGMPRGVYSGYPKLDEFLEDDNKLKFNWKTARRKSKKIIWAPHWSINDGVRYATFQWNYKFMYEFAKAHPEISWVVKPHPNLLFSAVKEKIFPSVAAFDEYLQAWNDLPNAQIYTGAYYQELFATSDGMIHDCGSFIAEYQYTHKPMIYLTRDTQEFNEIAQKILDVSYLVDGRDLDGIAALMQKIFIDGEDPKRSERKKFFDENLNYYKHNGMSASEFIYRNIRDELKV